MFQNIPVVIVVAMSKERQVIGRNNDLLWDLPADLQRFRTETMGKPVVMGRKTFESILAIAGRPLPKRPNIVVTRNTDYTSEYEQVTVVDSLEAGLEEAAATRPSEIHIGGGSQLYALALPYVDEIRATLVDDEPEGDSFFPDFKDTFNAAQTSESMTENGITYQWVTFTRSV